MRNIISILEAGNREQFHSSFIAWLLNKNEQHGFNNAFIDNFLKIVGEDHNAEYEVFTERTDGPNRYDILLKRKDGKRKIAIENKTKSLGYIYQIEKYKMKVNNVILLSLIKENFKDTVGMKHITYSDIVSILKQISISSKYKVLIDDYIDYLDAMTSIYQNLHRFCLNQLSHDKLLENYLEYKKIISENENDKRFLQLFYYYNFINYLKENNKDLIFGTQGYNKGDATRWIYEKNMQGPSFMESLIYSPKLENPNLKLKNDLFEVYSANSFIIAFRFQISISIDELIKTENHAVGEFLIGTWTKELHKYLQSNENYKSIFKRKGSRNFHSEPITIDDLKYENLSNKLKNNLLKLYTF